MVVNTKNKPYFYINGHLFHVRTDSESESEIQLNKTKMYVPSTNYGYTDIQWNNFTGETIDLTIYSTTDEVYSGDHVQPPDGTGAKDFYKTPRTPHAVLKYWAQFGIVCTVKTNIQAHESGNYLIDDGITQSSPQPNFIITKLKLIQYEKPEEMIQTYWKPNQTATNNKNTSQLSASYMEIKEVTTPLKQTCLCKKSTDASNCTASSIDGVQIIQKYLQKWGYLPWAIGSYNISVNGKFCYNTTQALKNFQEKNKLTVTGTFNLETKEAFLKKIQT